MKLLKNLSQGLASSALVTSSVLFSHSAIAAPSAPQDIAGRISNNSVSLEWDAVEGAAGYNVYVNNNYLTTTQTNSYSGDAVSGEVYNFYVTAFTTSPTEFSSRSDQLTLPESAIPDDLTIPPSVPTGLTGSITGTTVSINWEPSTDDEAVAGYNIYENNQYLTTVFGTQYEGTVIAGASYSYSVVAFDTRVNFSQASTRLTLPDLGPVDTTIPPSTPTGLSGDITGSGSQRTVRINWNEATDDQAVAGYNVYENDNYKATVFGTSYEASVNADTPYTYYVVAFDFDENYAQRTSPIALPGGIVVANDTQAPSIPNNVAGTWNVNGGTADITLSWDASTDNVGIAGYNVYENGAYLTTVQGTSFTTSVDSSTAYTYRVVAFDIARNFSAGSVRRTLPEGTNHAPVFADLTNQTGEAGQTINIVIKPTDKDGDVPGLFIGNLPTGMQSIDNLDGTRTLRWNPLQPDVGSYNITVTALDAVDPSLRTEQTFSLTIAMPDDPSTIPNAHPGIDFIGEHLVRAGDTVVMEVKATDANGTIPDLTIENLPEGASFERHPDPEYRNFKVLRWTTNSDNIGQKTLSFKAVDSEDPTMVATSSVPITITDASRFVRSGERLKDLGNRNDLLIGYASLLNYFNRPDADLYQATAAEEFNLVTAENSMKWGYINPEPGKYRFAAADTLVEFAAANNMKLHGHTLVWYTSLPQWVQNSPLDEREGLMYDFIDTMTERYNTVDIWDVVNEAFEDDGTYRNSTWYQAMGEDHIEKAFRRARAGAPSAELIYNDYDIAYGDAKTDATYALMQKLIANGAPIDGIGFQMHIGADFTAFDKIQSTFERFANLGLDIYITEMDVGKRDGTSDADQANVFKQITRICLDQPACKALQVWGVTDRYTWLPGTDPLLLDRNYQPKPAYTAMQEALAE